MKYSCSKPNQKSPSSSIVALPFDTWGVESGFSTSVITRYPFSLTGSGKIATGFNRQSEDPPSACLVELPSKFQIGQSSNLPLKFSLNIILLLMFWVGEYPSNQIYSNFALSAIGNRLTMRFIICSIEYIYDGLIT